MTVAFRAQSTAWATGTTSIAPTIPSGTTTGDIMVLWVHCKPHDATFSDPSGWTLLDSGASGTTANGNGTGSVKSGCWYREWQSGDAAPTVNITTGNTAVGVIYSFSKTAATWTTPPDVGKGGDQTNDATPAITYTGLASGDITSDDLLTYTTGVCDDASAHSAATLTATSATIGAVTRRTPDGTNTSGLDCSGWGGYAAVTAGTSTATLTGAFTVATAEPAFMSIAVRLREIAATDYAQTFTDAEGSLDAIAVTAPQALTVRGGTHLRGDDPLRRVLLGVDHAASQTDNLGVLDSLTTVLEHPQTDALGLTDSVTQESVYTLTQTDTLGLTDSVTYELGTVFEQTDALGLVDSVTSEAALSREQSDVVGLEDFRLVAGQQPFNVRGGTYLRGADQLRQDSLPEPLIRSQTDLVGLTDVVAADLARELGDALGLTDSVSEVEDLALSVTETPGITDSVSIDLARDLSDALGATDSVSWASEHQVALTYTEGLTDSVDAITEAGLDRTFSESLGIGDPTDQAADHVTLITDVVGATDSTEQTLEHLVSDALGVVDSVVVAVDHVRDATDTEGSLDSQVVDTGGDVSETITDGASIEDSLSGVLTGASAVVITWAEFEAPGVESSAYEYGFTDSLGGADSHIRDLGAEVTDAQGLSDSTTQAATTEYELVAAAALGDSVLGLLDLGALTDLEGVADSATRSHDSAPSVTELAGFTDSVAVEFTRELTDALGFTETRSQAQDSAVAITELSGLTDSVSAELNREFSDSSGLTDSLSWVSEHYYSVSDLEGLTDSADAILQGLLDRVLTDSVAIGDSTALVGEHSKAVTDPLGATDSAAGTLERSTTDAVGVTDSITVSLGHVVTTSDVTGLTDSQAVEAGEGATQTVTNVEDLSDSVSVVQALAIELTDSVGLADSTTQEATTEIEFTDVVGLSDSVSASLGHLVTVTDVEGIGDIATAVLNPLLYNPTPRRVEVTTARRTSAGTNRRVGVGTARRVTSPTQRRELTETPRR